MNPYDRVPLPGIAHSFATPDRTSVFAALHGLAPVLPSESTVLELGCGDGANLLAIAQRFPTATCIGVDSSETALATARERAQLAGLTNVNLLPLDLGALDGPGPLPPCDAIIAHDLLSFVSPSTRRATLELVGRLLKPSGVALLSFLTWPGQHDLEPLRTLMRHHVARVEDPAKKIAQARDIALWQLDRTRRLQGDARASLLHDLVLEWHQMSDAAFFHDLLAEHRHPLSLTAMVDEARSAGLAWLANARKSEPRNEFLPDNLRELVRELPDPVTRQAYLDAFLMTRSRTSLFCPIESPIKRTASPLDFMAFAAVSLIPADRVADLATVVIDTPVGSIRLGPEATALLKLISAARPRAPWLSELGDPEAIGLAASELWMAEAIELTLDPPDLPSAVSATPRASPLARLLAAERRLAERPTVTTLWHRELALSPEELEVLVACDGNTPRAADHPREASRRCTTTACSWAEPASREAAGSCSRSNARPAMGLSPRR